MARIKLASLGGEARENEGGDDQTITPKRQLLGQKIYHSGYDIGLAHTRHRVRNDLGKVASEWFY